MSARDTQQTPLSTHLLPTVSPGRRRLLKSALYGAGVGLVGCGGSSDSVDPPEPRPFDLPVVYAVAAAGSVRRQLMLLRPDGTIAELAPDVGAFALTPDRRSVVFSNSLATGLYRVDLAAPGRLVTIHVPVSGQISYINVSPSGARVAFVVRTGVSNGASAVLDVGINGGAARVVDQFTGIYAFLTPARCWSSDESQLMYHLSPTLGGTLRGLRVAELATGGDRFDVVDYDPARFVSNLSTWLPANQGVAYAADERIAGRTEPRIYRFADRAKYSLMPLRTEAAFTLDLAVSAATQQVLFRGDLTTRNTLDIYSAPLTASGLPAAPSVAVGGPRTDAGASRFALSPDGQRVAYISSEVTGSAALLEVLISAAAPAPATVIGNPLRRGEAVFGLAYTPAGDALVYNSGTIVATQGVAENRFNLLMARRAAPGVPQQVNEIAAPNGGLNLDAVVVPTSRGLAAVYSGDLRVDGQVDLYYSYLDEIGLSTRLAINVPAGSSLAGFAV